MEAKETIGGAAQAWAASSLVPRHGKPAHLSVPVFQGAARDMLAALEGYDFETVISLIELGVPVDYVGARDETALIKAAGHAQSEGVVKVLIEHGANVDHANAFRRTGLMKAAAAGNLGQAKILVEAGADLFLQDCKRKTALDCKFFDSEWTNCTGRTQLRNSPQSPPFPFLTCRGKAWAASKCHSVS